MRSTKSSSMAFSLSIDKNQSRDTENTESTEFSVKNGKIRSIREIRVQKILNSDFEKAMNLPARHVLFSVSMLYNLNVDIVNGSTQIIHENFFIESKGNHHGTLQQNSGKTWVGKKG